MLDTSLEKVFKGTPYEKYIPVFKMKGFGSIKDLNIPVHQGKLNEILETIIEDKNDIYPIQKLITKEREKYVTKNSLLVMFVLFLIIFLVWFFTPRTFSPSPSQELFY